MKRFWNACVIAAILLACAGCESEEAKVLRAVDSQTGQVVTLKGDDTVLENVYETDIVIVGGSLSALTAAIACCESGRKTMLIQESDGFGSCFEGTSAYPETRYTEISGSSARVKEFRKLIRNWYRVTGSNPPPAPPELMALSSGDGTPPFCFGTDAALAAVDSMLAGYEARGRLTVLPRCKVVEVLTFSRKLASVTVMDLDNRVVHGVRGWLFLDATETGELLPFAGIPFAIGTGAADSASAYDVRYFADTLEGKSSGTAVTPLLAEQPSGGEPFGTVFLPREPRRILAALTVNESDLLASARPGPRAAFFQDSVGIGYGAPGSGILPFQIPLGAMISADYVNLIVAGPSISSSRGASAAFQSPAALLAIGESAGVIAEFCAGNNLMTDQILGDRAVLQKLQQQLVERRGVPIYWYDDVAPGADAFVEAQMKPFLDPGFHERQATLSYLSGPS